MGDIALCLIIPIVFVLIFYLQFPKDEVPSLKLVAYGFLGGLFSVLPVFTLRAPFELISETLSFWPRIAIISFVEAGLVEEACKCLFIWWLARPAMGCLKATDGLLLGVSVGLGFGVSENLANHEILGGDIGIMHAYSAMPMHAMMSGLAGYAIARSRFLRDRTQALRVAATGFAVAVTIHGCYDFMIFSESLLAIGLPFLIVGTFYMIQMRMMRPADG